MSSNRSIKYKREAAIDAWNEWSNGKITGKERDEKASKYLDYSGMKSGSISDIEAVIAEQKAARYSEILANRAYRASERHDIKSSLLLDKAEKAETEKEKLKVLARAEKEAQKSSFYADKSESNKRLSENYLESKRRIISLVSEKEKSISEKLRNGEIKITAESKQAIISGKREISDVEASIQRWKDSVERSIRVSSEKKAAKEIERAKDRYKEGKQPGIEWKGGELRAGTMSGQTLPVEIAAYELVDKYMRSTMPKNGIVPKITVRGMGPDGEILEDTVPREIMERIMIKAIDGDDDEEPASRELIAWLLSFQEDNEVDDIELSGRNAAEFKS